MDLPDGLKVAARAPPWIAGRRVRPAARRQCTLATAQAPKEHPPPRNYPRLTGAKGSNGITANVHSGESATGKAPAIFSVEL